MITQYDLSEPNTVKTDASIDLSKLSHLLGIRFYPLKLHRKSLLLLTPNAQLIAIKPKCQLHHSHHRLPLGS